MITGKQRRYLKKLAHDIDPLVYIGKNDLTENVIKEIDNLLEARELVKVKIQENIISLQDMVKRIIQNLIFQTLLIIYI